MKSVRNLCFLLILPILSHANNSQWEMSHLACTEKNYQASDDGGYYLVTLNVNKQSLIQPEEYPDLSPEEGFASERVSKHFNKDLICKLTGSGSIHRNKKLPKLNPLIEEEQIETFNPKVNFTVRDYSWENLNSKVEELKLTHPTLQASLNEAEYSFSNSSLNTSAPGFNQFKQDSSVPNASAYTKVDKLLTLIAGAGTLLLMADYHDAATLASLAVVGVAGGALKVLPFLSAQAAFTAMLNLQAHSILATRVLSNNDIVGTSCSDYQNVFALPDSIAKMEVREINYEKGLEGLASHYETLKTVYEQVVQNFEKNFLSNHKELVNQKNWDALRDKFTKYNDPIITKWSGKVPTSEKDRESVLDYIWAIPSITMGLIIKQVVKAPAFSVAAANLAQHGVNTALDYYFEKPWEHAVIPYCEYDSQRPWDYPHNLCSTCKSFSCRYGFPGLITVLALKTAFMSKIKIN